MFSVRREAYSNVGRYSMTGPNESWIDKLPSWARARLSGRHMLQKILSNIIWLSADKVLRLGISAVIGIWMARYLGPDQFGLLSYAAAFVALFTPLATLGIDTILVRDLIGEDDADRRISMGTAFAMRIAGSTLGAIGATILIVAIRPGEQVVMILVILSALGMYAIAFDIIDLWFQSQVKAKFAVYAKNGAFIAVSAVRVALLLLHAPLMAFAWATLAELLLGAAALVFMYHRKGLRLTTWQVRIERSVRFLSDSWPLTFTVMGTILYMRLGQVMLGNIMTDREVGEYSVGVRLAEAWYFLPVAISSSVFPSILSARRTDAIQYARRLKILYGSLATIAVLVAIPTSFLSHQIIIVLFGEEYAAAGTVLALYVWGSLPVFLGVASNQYLIAENRTQIMLFRTMLGFAVNIGLNYLLIPLLGTAGAAVAALISYTVATFAFALVPDMRGHLLLMAGSLSPRFLLGEVRKVIRH